MNKLRILHNQPWFSDKIRQKIIICRHKENTWRKDSTEYNLNAFYNQQCFVSNIIKTAKRDYYIKAIHDNRLDYKKIFFTANKLLYRNELLLLPPTDNKKQLADNFNNFFVIKIDKIMSELLPNETRPMDLKYIESSYETSVRLGNFMEIDSEYMRTLIASAPVKSCKLHPIPTTLLWNLDLAVPIITKIIHLSLNHGEMPDVLKEALPRPLLKKSNLDLIFKNYHPVPYCLTFLN